MITRPIHKTIVAVVLLMVAIVWSAAFSQTLNLSAEKPVKRVGFIPIRTTGGKVDAVTDSLTKSLYRAMQKNGKTGVVLLSQLVKGPSETDTCISEACVLSLAEKTRATAVIWGTIETSNALSIVKLFSGSVADKRVIARVTTELGSLYSAIDEQVLRLVNSIDEVPPPVIAPTTMAKDSTTKVSTDSIAKVLAAKKDSIIKIIAAKKDSIVKVLAAKDSILKVLAAKDSTAKDTAVSLEMVVKSYASLELISNPDSVPLSINGQSAGLTPYKSDSLAPGVYTVAINADGYIPFSSSISLPEKSQKKIRINLVSNSGTLKIRSLPAGAKVHLNDTAAGKTPYSSTKVKPGSYKVNVSLDNYLPQTKLVSIVKGQTEELDFRLVSKTYADSVKKAKHVKFQWVRRIGLGVLAAGLGGFGLVYNYQAAQNIDKQNKVYDEYKNMIGTDVEFQKKWEEYQSYNSTIADKTHKRNVCYILGGCFAVGFAFSIPF